MLRGAETAEVHERTDGKGDAREDEEPDFRVVWLVFS